MICNKEIRIPLFSHIKLIMPLALLFALLSSIAVPAAGQQYQAGVHYDVLEIPVRTRDSSKVEVVEVFWYGCSHCYTFDSHVNKWKAKQADDVDFWLSPAVWNNTMKLHAKAYYTAQELGVSEKLHIPLFTTLVVERKRLSNKKEIGALFADYGVDRAKFDSMFDSFGVQSMAKQADARARSYKISGTPEMVVNGKYRVSASKAGGQVQMLSVVDYLVSKERALLAAK